MGFRMKRTTQKSLLSVRVYLWLWEVVAAADQIQLYNLFCRQVARTWGFTAAFCLSVVGVQRQRHAHQRVLQ